MELSYVICPLRNLRNWRPGILDCCSSSLRHGFTGYACRGCVHREESALMSDVAPIALRVKIGFRDFAIVVFAVRLLRHASPGSKHFCMGNFGLFVLTTRHPSLALKKNVLHRTSLLLLRVLPTKPAIAQRRWNGGSTTAQHLMEPQARLSLRKGILSLPSAKSTVQEIRKMIKMTESMKACLKPGSKPSCLQQTFGSPVWAFLRSRHQQWIAT